MPSLPGTAEGLQERQGEGPNPEEAGAPEQTDVTGSES